jgi:hypothetical protein
MAPTGSDTSAFERSLFMVVGSFLPARAGTSSGDLREADDRD